MFIKQDLSALPLLLNPSAMLAGTETAARRNCEVSPNISGFGNSVVNL